MSIYTEQDKNNVEQRIKEISDERSKKAPRKKTPKELAVIDQNGCTGCEVCIIFCPVDCIEIVPGDEHSQFQQVVEVDYARCIGCSKCEPECPWNTIQMIAYEEALKEAPSVTLKSVCNQPAMQD